MAENINWKRYQALLDTFIKANPDVKKQKCYDECQKLWNEVKGVYVNLLLSHVHHFRNEESFIAYLHSVLLEIASQAYVYYHLFSLNSSVSRQRSSSLSAQCYSHRKGSNSALSKLTVQDSDIHIIEHLVELISCQQLDQFFSKINTPPEFTASSLKFIKEVCRTVRC